MKNAFNGEAIARRKGLRLAVVVAAWVLSLALLLSCAGAWFGNEGSLSERRAMFVSRLDQG